MESGYIETGSLIFVIIHTNLNQQYLNEETLLICFIQLF